ncbi:MAG: kynureninase [Candidatus Obscuribacterales bacterium]|nr:kynureninase [Candidatus Obscuribacterales bacterium]
MTSSQTSNREAVTYDDSEGFAQLLDKRDPLAPFREEFLFPPGPSGSPVIYMSGNSLGLQPKKVRDHIEQELNDWANFGVEGHFHAKYPWVPYHENLTESTARLVGALPHEVVVMNSLTVNLHLMMVSFYRPTKTRYRILIEGAAFPSDQYAVASQARFHGYAPSDAVIEVTPREGEETIRHEDILAILQSEGESIALVMLGNCNYLTGQAFDMKSVTAAAQAQGCVVGYNLAHGAGNLEMRLHDWNVDFAVWCSYKYLNAGPGGIAGCFVHERHASNFDLPRLAGWWGHDKQSRFLMGPSFNPIVGAEGWQLSNPPIFQLAALHASMTLFDKAGIANLRKKSEMLTGYMEFMLDRLPDGACRIITPRDPAARGCQLSLHLDGNPKQLISSLKEAGAVCDFREPDVVRVAPAPLYNSFSDVWRFATMLGDLIRANRPAGAPDSTKASDTTGSDNQ